MAANKRSYFEECERDDEGHCKPKGTGSTSSAEGGKKQTAQSFIDSVLAHQPTKEELNSREFAQSLLDSVAVLREGEQRPKAADYTDFYAFVEANRQLPSALVGAAVDDYLRDNKARYRLDSNFEVLVNNKTKKPDPPTSPEADVKFSPGVDPERVPSPKVSTKTVRSLLATWTGSGTSAPDMLGPEAFAPVRQAADRWLAGGKAPEWDALYSETQKRLTSIGFQSATLFRGIGLAGDHPLAKKALAGELTEGNNLFIESGTVNAWADVEDVAVGYALDKAGHEKVQVVIARDTPREDVVASPLTQQQLLEMGDREYILKTKEKTKVRVVAVYVDGKKV